MEQVISVRYGNPRFPTPHTTPRNTTPKLCRHKTRELGYVTLDGLGPRQAPGAVPKLTDDLAPVLREWVIAGPAACGLDRANWTYAELADHLFRERGIRVRKSATQVFWSRHHIRPYRPTDRFLRGDPAKQATAREELAALKKSRAAHVAG